MRKSRTVLTQNTVYKVENLTQSQKNPFKIEDLVLSEVIKKELGNFILEAKRRKLDAENVNTSTLFQKRKGLIGLFCGPSGTGKTMTAQVLANELQLDLYRIDLSEVVNKYIGETEKNLKRIFDAAEDGNSILLFDEADALFGKHNEEKDVHYRNAIIETINPLQAIEKYPGIVIISLDRKENVNNTFLQSIRFVLEFPLTDSDPNEKN